MLIQLLSEVGQRLCHYHRTPYLYFFFALFSLHFIQSDATDPTTAAQYVNIVNHLRSLFH